MNQNERMLPGDPQKKTYMSDQEFTAHMEELISTPNAEANHNLLDLANNLMYTPTTVLADSQGALVGEAIIGGQADLSAAYLEAVNQALEAGGKDAISLEDA